MGNGIDRLISMANQIGVFFEAQPNREEAVAGIVDHITRFWDPRMRRSITAHVKEGGVGLSAIAMEAVKKLPS